MTKFTLTAAAFLALLGTPALAGNGNGELSSADRAEVTRVQQQNGRSPVAASVLRHDSRDIAGAFASRVGHDERAREAGQSN